MKISIDTASASQIADYATVHLGLDVNFRMGKDKILAVMAQAGFTQAEIEIADEEPQVERIVPSGPASAAKGDRKMIKIMIPTQEIPGSTAGKEPVVVGVNGVVARIKRGVVVEVPEEYVEALTNATKVVYDKGPNGEPINPTFVPTHPFSIMA